MRITITLTQREIEFLQRMQDLMNREQTEIKKYFSFEDIVHECLEQLIALGASMHKGQA